MERTVKKTITALIAMFFGSATGCVMDAHDQNRLIQYYDKNYFNVASVGKCSIDKSQGGSEGGCGGCVIP